MSRQDFPQEAFLSGKNAVQKLSQLFNLHAYRAEDIRNFRTSVYYSNFSGKGNAFNYEMAIGHASRLDDGRFTVFTSHTRIREDSIRGSLSVRCLKENKDPVLCEERDVLQVLGALGAQLAEKSSYALAFPRNAPIRLYGTLHIATAREIFDHPCKKAEILYHQERVESSRRWNPAFS